MMSTPYLIVVGVVILAMIGLLGFLIVRNGGSGDEKLVSALETAETNLPVDLANGTKLGKDDAPLKLVSYEDFQCPFCLAYTAEDEPTIVEEYVKAGKVQIEYRHLPILGQESVRAAVAAECAAEQNKFWQFHGKIFLVQAQAGQVDNEKIDDGRLSDKELKKFAGEVGLDQAQFDSCLDGDKYLADVNADDAQAKQFGISGTPNFLLNGVPMGSDVGPVDNWRKFLDEQYTKVTTATATPSVSPTALLTIVVGSPTAAAGTTTPAAGTTTPAPTGTSGAAATATRTP